MLHLTPLFDISQLYALFTDTVGPGDVGLKEENVDVDRGHGPFGLSQFNRIARWAQPITYVDIFECESFTVSPTHPFYQMAAFVHCSVIRKLDSENFLLSFLRKVFRT